VARPAARDAQDPPALRIRLLGELELRLEEAPLPPLESARAESLLAYLLLHRDAAQPRQRLAFLLWPDSTEPQARTNLRHVLHKLRRALPDADRFVDVGSRTLRWRTDAPVELDVATFEEALARAARDDGDVALAALQEAVAAYAGDLLEGSYDDWVLEQRERLRQRYLEALERLTRLHEQRGEAAQAVPYAERLLRHDPLREETYRLLMRLHDVCGNRARALRVYHACTATLERELGVEPSAATRQVYEGLLPAADEGAAGEEQARRAGSHGLVGRTTERTRLTELWREAERGHARLVLVTGEAGVGKTRLLEELREWCEHRGAVTAEARSYAAEGALAYGPVVAWLRSEQLAARRGRLDRGRLGELSRLLPELGEASAARRPEPLSDSEQRQHLFDAVAAAILATGGPLLLVAEDLHWCDRETLQFLHYLLRSEPDAPLLVAASARREETDQQHPLTELVTGLQAIERLVEIELGRLSRQETGTLAERAGGRPLGESQADRLFAETEGNPLFVVEALRAGWTGEGSGGESISPKVQAVLESRLAQLSSPSRDLVGVAAAIGREFTSELVGAAGQADEDTLVRALDELWRRRIVREQGADSYDFSHDKIREVAYQSLSPARRRSHHLAVAHALEHLHGADPAAVSAQLASQYDRAAAVREAIPWYAAAASEAERMSASRETIRLLERALALVRTLPEAHERDEHELALLTALLAPLGAVEGSAAAALTEVQSRSLELSRSLGVEPAPPVLRSLALTTLSEGRFEQAREAGKQLRVRAERDEDDMALVESHYLLGIASFWQGELRAAKRHFEAAVARYRPEYRASHLVQYGLDPKVICLSRLGNTLWFLGRPDAAGRARDSALALAEEIGHPHSHGVALVFAMLLGLELRDDDAVRRYVAALDAWRQDHEYRAIEDTMDALAGYVDVLDGLRQRGLARIERAAEQSLAEAHAPGMNACIVRVLLEACRIAGDPRTGLGAADRRLATGGGAGLWEAEVRRLRAEFLASLGAPGAQVDSELVRALAVARARGAKALELRAATSLLRHRLEQGDERAAREARERLAAVLAGLPEAHGTGDRDEAEALVRRR
jgi:DNA-binding SARP family transcriptional activator